MNDDFSFLTRRRFVKSSSSLVALGTLPVCLTTNAEELSASLGGLQQQHGVVLYRHSQSHALAFATTLSQAGFRTIALQDDPVRQWRDGLGTLAAQSEGPLLGLSNWADYLLVRGLAAEQRKHVMLEVQHSINQPGNVNWPVDVAEGYLRLTPAMDNRSLAKLLQKPVTQNAVTPGTPTLFSWLVA